MATIDVLDIKIKAESKSLDEKLDVTITKLKEVKKLLNSISKSGSWGEGFTKNSGSSRRTRSAKTTVDQETQARKNELMVLKQTSKELSVIKNKAKEVSKIPLLTKKDSKIPLLTKNNTLPSDLSQKLAIQSDMIRKSLKTVMPEEFKAPMVLPKDYSNIFKPIISSVKNMPKSEKVTIEDIVDVKDNKSFGKIFKDSLRDKLVTAGKSIYSKLPKGESLLAESYQQTYGKLKEEQKNLKPLMRELYSKYSSGELDSKQLKQVEVEIGKLDDKMKELDVQILKVVSDYKKLPVADRQEKFRPSRMFRKPNSDMTGYFANQNKPSNDDSGGSKGSSILGFLGKGGLKIANVGMNMLTGAFKKLGNVVSDLLKPLSRTWKMLRLMFVRTVLRSIVTLTQQGFGNLIKYSDTFNASVSLLWNSMRQLSNAFAAMASPIINKFSDNINDLIQQIIDGVNAINQFISALLGFDTWTKATVLTDNYRDSLDGATGSAKALKRQLQGFDELNNITSPSSGGGGGKNNTTDPKFMFTEEEIGSGWKHLSDMLKQTWNSDADFSWFGKTISNQLVEQLEKIDWEAIQAKTKKIATAIATFLNGFINPESFGTVGKTIGQALQTAIDFAFTFVETFDWKNAGTSIASLVNNVFDNVDWKEVGQTISDFVKGALDLLVQFVVDTDWSKVTSAIVDVISNLDTFEIKTKLEELGAAVLEAVIEALFGVGSSLADNLSDKLRELGFDSAADFFDGISDKLSEGSSILDGKFSELWDNVTILPAGVFSDDIVQVIMPGWIHIFEKLKEPITGFIEYFSWDSFFETFMETPTVFDDILPYVLPGWVGIFDKLKEPISNLSASDLWDSFTNNFTRGLSGAVASIDVKSYGSTLGNGFVNGIKNPNGTNISDAVGTVFKAAWENVKKNFTLENITSHANDLRKKFLNGFYTADGHDGLSKTLGTIFGDARDNVKKNFTVENITNHANNLRKNFLNGFYTADGHDGVAKTTGTIFSDAYNNMKKGFSIDSVKSYFNSVVAGIKSPFTTMASFMKTTFTDAWTKVQEVFSQKGKIFEGIKEGIADAFKHIVDSLIDGINNVIAVPFNAIKNALTIIRGSKIAGAFHFKNLPAIEVPVIPHVQLKAKGDYDLEDGWFRANHGEIMGTFDNGTSVVANNTHIIQGISEGVNRGMQGANREMINLLMVQNGILQGILEKETGISTSDIFNAVMSENKSYYNMTGANAFVL